MWMVLVGAVLVTLKFTEVDPVAGWSWWWVLSPFAVAFAWWTWADSTGLTKRREIEKMEDRKENRRRKAFEALGIDYRKTSKSKARADTWKAARKAQIEKVEGKRAAERKKHADTIANSRFQSSYDTKPAETAKANAKE